MPDIDGRPSGSPLGPRAAGGVKPAPPGWTEPRGIPPIPPQGLRGPPTAHEVGAAARWTVLQAGPGTRPRAHQPSPATCNPAHPGKLRPGSLGCALPQPRPGQHLQGSPEPARPAASRTPNPSDPEDPHLGRRHPGQRAARFATRLRSRARTLTPSGASARKEDGGTVT